MTSPGRVLRSADAGPAAPPDPAPGHGRTTAALLTILSTLVAAIVTVFTAAPAQAATDAAYVMGYFKESPSGAGNVNAVHFAVSTDGLQWTPLNGNNAILTPTVGTRGIRDPYLSRLNDGTWVLAATDIAKGGSFTAPNPNIHIWTSPDLVNWSADRLLSINAANPASYTWAPAIYWDAERNQYGISYSTVPSGFNHSVIMVVYTSDFVTVTAPVVLYDNGVNIIDSHVITGVGGFNYLYYKNQATGRLAGARSATLRAGSFAKYTDGVSRGCIEAPTLVKSLTANTWWLWGDAYCPNNVFYAWQGDLATANWTPLDQRAYTPPLLSKHNTIATITAADHQNLLNRYGGTSWNRLKSSNVPDRYLRHAGNVARIDAVPFDPYQDSQWRLVPGLADSAGVSFESVNFPGRYLRHTNFTVVLAANDNTAGFRADATFYRQAGRADSGWSSFRSYNYPARYLRHSNFVMRLDEITTATGRADATFQVGY